MENKLKIIAVVILIASGVLENYYNFISDGIILLFGVLNFPLMMIISVLKEE